MPPLVARAIVTAATPPVDYDCVIGDLHEEFLERVRSDGTVAANRWYWSQTLRSVPSLLSYSRTQASLRRFLGTAIVAAIIVLAMLSVNEFVETAMCNAFAPGCGIRGWAFYLVGWLNAALFGGVLAALVRSQGVRLALASSFALLFAIAIPIVLGFSSRLTASTWILLLGAVPAMSLGAAAFQIARRR